MSRTLESTTTVGSTQVSTHDDEYLIEQLIRQIQTGHESAAAQLREFMARGVRWYLRRNARDLSIEESAEQVLDALIQAIKDYQVTNLATLTSFTRTSVRAFSPNPSATRVKAGSIDSAGVESVKQALCEFSAGEREALVRYFEGQPPERISADLGIGDQALSALRSRLRTRCDELTSGR